MFPGALSLARGVCQRGGDVSDWLNVKRERQDVERWQFLRQHDLHQVGGSSLSPFQMEGTPLCLYGHKGKHKNMNGRKSVAESGCGRATNKIKIEGAISLLAMKKISIFVHC